MSDDPEGEPTDPLFDLLLQKFLPEFTALADSLDIPNDELARVAESMDDKEGLGQVFAYLLRNTIHSRRLSALCSLMTPGEGCVSLADLVEREARLRGSS